MSLIVIGNIMALIAVGVALFARNEVRVGSKEKESFWRATQYIAIGVVIAVVALQFFTPRN